MPRVAPVLLLVACATPTADWSEPIAALEGHATWYVDFDAGAEADGHTDCAYVREYSAVEDRSQPWLCPQCDVLFRADSDMTLGREECHAQVSADVPAQQEWLGFGQGTWYRAVRENHALSAQGEVSVDGGELATHNEVTLQTTDGGTFDFTIDGQYEASVVTDDPMHGLHPPDRYACGWPRTEPPPYEGEPVLRIGEPLPDGVFVDACGDPVRLWDVIDDYAVIDVAAADCPPCRQMAQRAGDLKADLRRDGVGVRLVTLMGPSLQDPLAPADQALLVDWTARYDLDDPVLADRGFGVWVIGRSVGEDFGFPTSVVVAPDRTVLAVIVGFPGWAPFADAIRAHAGLR